MKKSGQAILILLVVVFSVMLMTGCEEEASNDRMAKLIANENRQLKRQLEKRDKEMQQQKQQLEKGIEKQTQLLEKCVQAKKILEQRSAEEISRQVQSVLGVIMEQNAKMRQETISLKKELEALKNPK